MHHIYGPIQLFLKDKKGGQIKIEKRQYCCAYYYYYCSKRGVKKIVMALFVDMSCLSRPYVASRPCL
jgi:hypothetical protein